MKKKKKKKIIEKNQKVIMESLEDLKMSLLNFNFVMIYIIHKMLILLEHHANYFKDSIFECFFKQYNSLLEKKKILFTTYNDGKFKS